MSRLLLSLGLSTGLATAGLAACPEPADVSEEINGLFDKARMAETFMEGRAVSAEMWEVWLRAPDETAHPRRH